MTVTRSEIEHVAHLARLGLDDHELDLMADQLSHILVAMESLRDLDTSAIPPTAQVIPLNNVFREDVARPAWPVDEILKNAPRTHHQYFVVPPIMED